MELGETRAGGHDVARVEQLAHALQPRRAHLGRVGRGRGLVVVGQALERVERRFRTEAGELPVLRGAELTLHGWIALTLGVVGTVLLAWLLMALAFKSDREGWDDQVDNRMDPGREDDPS